MENSKNSTTKIKRNNFFKYSGAAILGFFAVQSVPLGFSFLKSGKEKAKDSSLKVTVNPDAVSREKEKG